jgi:carboxypeptidase family protein
MNLSRAFLFTTQSSPAKIIELAMRRRLTSAMSHAGALVSLLIWLTATTGYPSEKFSEVGAISGVVRYAGVVPSPRPLTITKDPEVCGKAPLNDQSLLVGRDHLLGNAVVTIEDMSKGGPLKSKATVLFDQKGCQYIPHVAVFPAGATVVIHNSDGILHNIHTESAVNPVIDLAQPGFKKEIRVTIAKPEIIKVTCDAHNWMEGWWYVTSTPHYAKTDPDGRYAIRGVPPGTYTVRVWQERLGTQSQEVVVRPGGATAADFTFRRLESSDTGSRESEGPKL